MRQNGRPAEVLLVADQGDGTWTAMVHPGGKLKTNRTVRFGTEALLTIVEVLGGGLRRVRLDGPLSWTDLMAGYGTVPLPPYIDRPAEPEDRERYQTVFASVAGSVAAPTAGLHFTPSLLEAIRDRGVRVEEVVLHVGPGTFKPVQTDDPRDHTMHAEWYDLPTRTADAVNRAHGEGHCVWAVGTTVTRVLESAARDGELHPRRGWTSLFIYPPYRFRVVDALITNFHLPRSTLLLLVAAFAGVEAVRTAYAEAVRRRYRLFSFGDAMVVT